MNLKRRRRGFSSSVVLVMLGREAGSVAFGAAAPFNSTTIASRPAGPALAPMCFCTPDHIAWPAFISTVSLLPSAVVNAILPSVSSTVTLSGCSCITVFSPGPTTTCSTRTCALSTRT